MEKDEAILKWAHDILAAEGLNGWSIRRTGGGDYCWCDRKQIDLHTSRPVTAARFLHEVAHALYREPEGEHKNHYHGGEWADTFGRLVEKYMERRSLPPKGGDV